MISEAARTPIGGLAIRDESRGITVCDWRDS
jgi:hypothetical protein